MKRWLYGVAGCVGALFISQVAFGASSEMEILLKKLQEKGILSAEEAKDIAAETKQAAAESKEKETKTSELPDWVKNTKFKGDVRLRYEARDREDDTRGTQGRGRFRLRAGAETAITDQITAGFGLASGTGDQRSANQTLGGDFTRKSIWIDYAYAKWAPTKWFSIMGGKFTNPIWQPSDMLISSDVNPEGAAVKLEGKVNDRFTLLFNGGLFVLEDRNGTKDASGAYDTDPLMYVFQPGVKVNFNKDMFFRFAPAYYGFSNLKQTQVIGSGSPYIGGGFSAGDTNTIDQTTKKYLYDYSAINWGGEFGWNKPFGLSFVPYLGVMGGYISNPDPSSNNTGYLAGVTFGFQEVKKLGDWSFEYTYRKLEKDAWVDFLPDSSFYSGKTNVEGHRAKLLIGLAKNTALGLNYYNTRMIKNFSPSSSLTRATGSSADHHSPETLVQADLIFKF
jgi:hypothetical protein